MSGQYVVAVNVTRIVEVDNLLQAREVAVVHVGLHETSVRDLCRVAHSRGLKFALEVWQLRSPTQVRRGTVVAIEPTSGRVLAMVNQKLALSSGAQPCSTIKLSVALAALSEGLISKETPVALTARYKMNLTTALAHSMGTTLGRRSSTRSR